MQADAVGPSEDFRLTIKQISDDLDSDEVLTLKYLCNDYIPSKRLEEIKTGLDLFDVLCNKNLVTAEDTMYLAECLYSIQRMDLLSGHLRMTANTVRQMIKSSRPLLDPFRVMIMNVIECMDSSEVRKLAFCLDEYLPKKYTKYTSGYTLLMALERSGQLAPDNLHLLERLVKNTVEDENALIAIRNYKASRHETSSKVPGDTTTLQKLVIVPQAPPRLVVVQNRTGAGGTGGPRQPLPVDQGQKLGQQPFDDPINTSPSDATPGGASGDHQVETPCSAEAVGGKVHLPNDPCCGEVDQKSPSLLDEPGGVTCSKQPVPGEEDYRKIGGATGGVAFSKLPVPGMEGATGCVAFSKLPVGLPGEEESGNMEEATGGGDLEPPDKKKQQENSTSSFEGATMATGRQGDEVGKTNLYLPPSKQWTPAETAAIQTKEEPMLPSFLNEPEHVGSVASQAGELGPAPPDNEPVVEEIEAALPSILANFQDTDDEEPHPTEAADEDSIHVPPTQSDLPEVLEDGPNIAPGGDYIRAKTFEEMERELQTLREEIYKRENDMPSYKINANPRGVCIIINNVKFCAVPGGKRLKDRHGSDVDQENLRFIFNKLKFVIEPYKNLTRDQMMGVVKQAAHQTDHSKYDCFAFCVLTHGSKGNLYGVDGLPADVMTITDNFKGLNCPTLQGKPKLFFIQACQGHINQIGFKTRMEEDSDNNYGETPSLLPNEADFLVGYATLPGFVSYRSETHGSWYITMLTDMLDKHSDRHDLLSIMIKVNEEVAKASAMIEGGIYKQSPMPWPTLRKKVFLKVSD